MKRLPSILATQPYAKRLKVGSPKPINLPFELTQFIWSFIDNKTIEQFINNSKNNRKALDMLKFTWKRLGALVFEKAAKNGHLDIVKYCHENGCRWDSKTLTLAAKYGHLDIVKWLRSRDPPCPWNSCAPAKAAENGHLDIVKYCHENGCKWDSRTPELAETNRHFNIVLYCIENGCPWDEHVIRMLTA